MGTKRGVFFGQTDSPGKDVAKTFSMWSGLGFTNRALALAVACALQDESVSLPLPLPLLVLLLVKVAHHSSVGH